MTGKAIYCRQEDCGNNDLSKITYLSKVEVDGYNLPLYRCGVCERVFIVEIGGRTRAREQQEVLKNGIKEVAV